MQINVATSFKLVQDIINLPQIGGTSEAPETSVLELLMRRIQLCKVPRLFGHFHLFYKINLPKNKNGAWDFSPMDAPRQELSNGGLGCFVSTSNFWQIDFLMQLHRTANPAVVRNHARTCWHGAQLAIS